LRSVGRIYPIREVPLITSLGTCHAKSDPPPYQRAGIRQARRKGWLVFHKWRRPAGLWSVRKSTGLLVGDQSAASCNRCLPSNVTRKTRVLSHCSFERMATMPSQLRRPIYKSPGVEPHKKSLLTMAFAAVVAAAINPITLRLYAPQREPFVTARPTLRLQTPLSTGGSAIASLSQPTLGAEPIVRNHTRQGAVAAALTQGLAWGRVRRA
jgi:hypothetical protein